MNTNNTFTVPTTGQENRVQQPRPVIPATVKRVAFGVVSDNLQNIKNDIPRPVRGTRL